MTRSGSRREVVGDADAKSARPSDAWERAADGFSRWVAGDVSGLEELVGAMTPVLLNVVKGYRLPSHDVEDVVNATWLTLVRRRESIVDAHAIGGWLTTVARREAWRVSRAADRPVPFPAEEIVATHGDGDVTVQIVGSASAYARAVGDQVAILVDEVLTVSPAATSLDPYAMAEAIADLVVDKVADEHHNEIADLIAPFWTPGRTCGALGGLTLSALSDLRAAGSVLGVTTTDGQTFYPVSQFERHAGKVRVKPSLQVFLKVLRQRDPWTVAILTHTPAPELMELTPLDWVRRNRDPDILADYAQALNMEFSR